MHMARLMFTVHSPALSMVDSLQISDISLAEDAS